MRLEESPDASSVGDGPTLTDGLCRSIGNRLGLPARFVNKSAFRVPILASCTSGSQPDPLGNPIRSAKRFSRAPSDVGSLKVRFEEWTPESTRTGRHCSADSVKTRRHRPQRARCHKVKRRTSNRQKPVEEAFRHFRVRERVNGSGDSP